MSEPYDSRQAGTKIPQVAPWPRIAVDRAGWQSCAALLAKGSCTLLDLWAEPGTIHMAIMEVGTSAISVHSLACPDGSYPSVGAVHAPALRLERTAHDLYGLTAAGSPDQRAWLDHDAWGIRHPLLSGGTAGAPALPRYAFLTAEGDGLHQIPVGPVHAGIIEPGHFRFTASGETVVRLEERLGYVHKGVESLMAGAEIERAAQLAGRISGDSTVAYAFAFCRAVEAAGGTAVPARATWLRALAAELERLANHLGDIGAICNDASFSLMQAHCNLLRESVLRAADAAFGHRLMRDLIAPGGVSHDLGQDGRQAIRDAVAGIRKRFPALIELYDNTASLQDRTVDTGMLDPALAQTYAAGGYVGRAAERSFDARKTVPYPPYDALRFEIPVLREGDVNARVWIRIREVEQSLAIVDQLLDGLPTGAVRTALASLPGPLEGMALTEGFRGDVWAWVRIRDGRIERARLRDPSWFQWPLLEAVIEGNIVADFPLCNKSFNCSYSGHDL